MPLQAGNHPGTLRPGMPQHLRWMLALYALVGLAVVLWAAIRPGAGLADLFSPQQALLPFFATARPGMKHGMAFALGLSGGALLLAISLMFSRYFTWARRLEAAFAEILGPLRWQEAMALALASSLAEEALFRGLLQPWWGWLWASLAFGLLHIGPDRRFLPWTIMALASGALLGALSLLSGSLWAPIACHGLVNACNLHRIGAQRPEP